MSKHAVDEYGDDGYDTDDEYATDDGYDSDGVEQLDFSMPHLSRDLDMAPTSALAQLYESLGQDCFRILDLTLDPSRPDIPSCTLREASLDADPHEPYLAISHTWLGNEYSWYGQALARIAQLRFDGEVFEVRGWVAYILAIVFQTCGSTTVWMDVLSINQSDNVEKGHQVARMGDVFRKAIEVLVVLGKSTPNTDAALPLLAVSRSRKTSIDAGGAEIMNHRYWQRAWVLQEITLSKGLRLICGRASVGGRGSENVLANLDPSRTTGESIARSSGMESITRIRTELMPEILKILVLTGNAECEDPRDTLYAKIALAKNGAATIGQPDYSVTAEEAFTRFARTYIQETKSLDLLSCAGNGKATLPSWVPSWTPADFDSSIQLMPRPPARRRARDAPRFEFNDTDHGLELLARGYAVKLFDPDPRTFMQGSPDGSLEQLKLRQDDHVMKGQKWICRLYDTEYPIILQRMDTHWVLLPYWRFYWSYFNFYFNPGEDYWEFIDREIVFNIR